MLRNAVFAIVLSTGNLLLAQAPRYILEDLGPKNGGVTGINVRGQVIGYETGPDSRVRSFRTAPNSPIDWATNDLGTLGGTITRARGINASGQVVGESTLTAGEVRAFRTSPNSSIRPATDNLGTLGGSESRAFAVNDSGQVTGSSGRAFVTGPNEAINPATDLIDAKLGIYSPPAAGRYINNRGHVFGEIDISAPFYPTAFVEMDRAEPTALNIIRFVWEDFAGITEEDQVVFSPYSHLVLWQNGKSTVLADCGIPCVPVGVNNSMQIVGATPQYPFLFTGGVIYDLTRLIPDRTRWILPASSSAYFRVYINDVGQIAGVAQFNNETHAIRLDPIPSVSAAIDKALSMVSSLHLERGLRSQHTMLLKAAFASPLKAAMDAWNRGDPASTRGSLNEFENRVRAQIGTSLSKERADRLLELAEAAYALT